MSSKQYWEICLPEILDEIGIEINDDQMEDLISSVARCASVQGEYTSPAYYPDETESLKKKIKSLESRTPCTKCNGVGHKIMGVGPSHHTHVDCHHCNGKGWV